MGVSAPKYRFISDILLASLFGAGLIVLGYLLPRTAFWSLFSSYALLFAIYAYWCYRGPSFSIGRILLIGILFRLLLMGMTPNWSDDVHRFVWDGRIVASGGDPFETVPSSMVGTDKAEGMGLDRELYEKLNSPDYYSVYPPVEQFVFGASAWLAGNDAFVNTVFLRVFLLLADLAVALALMRLLVFFKFPKEGVAFYFLNPLVILEGVGNLHFEVLMIAFLLWGVYFALSRKALLFSGLLIGAAISTKLIPLILLPFFIRTHRWRSIPLFLIAGATVMISFWPWLSKSSMLHFWDSLNLYFQTFEFNGSIYELVKWAGFQWVGHNIIEQAGPALSFLTVLGVITLLIFSRLQDKKDLFVLFTFALSLHLFMATTVHPWYLLPLIAFLPFLPFRYPMLWSLLIVLSYSAYSSSGNVPSALLCLEYGGLFMFFFFELRQHWDQIRRIFGKSLLNLPSGEKRDP